MAKILASIEEMEAFVETEVLKAKVRKAHQQSDGWDGKLDTIEMIVAWNRLLAELQKTDKILLDQKSFNNKVEAHVKSFKANLAAFDDDKNEKLGKVEFENFCRSMVLSLLKAKFKADAEAKQRQIELEMKRKADLAKMNVAQKTGLWVTSPFTATCKFLYNRGGIKAVVNFTGAVLNGSAFKGAKKGDF